MIATVFQGQKQDKDMHTRTVLAVFVLCWPSMSHAKDCHSLEEKVAHYEALRRQGGSPKQMARWQLFQREHETELQQCRTVQPPALAIIDGSAANTKAPHRDKLRHRQHPSATEQQLLATCNYWITQNNQQHSANTQAMKEAACADLDHWTGADTKPVSYQQPLAKCIKPGNKIDEEVAHCMKQKTPQDNQPQKPNS
ncbi:MAG: hypothetical protein KGM99_15585 [Burkholderiales bacterium]|nr:hypothetical protein [Burkholderiales bacterium]